MHTYYGSYQALEKEFLAYVTRLQPGPQRPVLVLCPSGRLAAYLRERLTCQNGMISNLFFVTFSQLMDRLDEENGPDNCPLLPANHFQDYVLKELLLRPEFNRYPVSRGFISAVKASLRDLADAQVDAAVLQEYIQTSTDPVVAGEQEHIKWLCQLYGAYYQKLDQIPGYRSYRTYFAQVMAQAEHSAWLSRFKQMIVYGFYEFTGRQLDLFNVLRSHYPLQVFWAYTQEPAYRFGQKFFEANILGASLNVTPLPRAQKEVALSSVLPHLFTETSAAATPACLQVVSAPDPEGELFFVVKEMMRLHEEEGMAYADMALTARSMAPYQRHLPAIMSQNGIVLEGNFLEGIASRPLGVFILNLLSLARGGFAKEDVLAVINSSYFKHKNKWRYFIQASLVQRDYAQWADLIQPTLAGYDPAFLSWMQQLKSQLDFLEHAQSWAALRSGAAALLQENTDTADFSAAEQSLWQSVQEVLDSFTRYESISPRAQAGEFLEELLAALQALPIHQVYTQPGGVQVTEVSGLRGQQAKVLFVLGLNEKVFPQVMQEDPILTDYYRRILRDQLGFWINQKMERFEEERLLFSATAQAASERIYFSFLRATQDGKPCVPSSYLMELARAARLDWQGKQVVQVPAHMIEQLSQVPLKRLTPKELSHVLAAQGAGLSAYSQAGLQTDGVADTLQAAGQLASVGSLTPYDGVVSSGQEIFAAQNGQGFSPSALQDLARCPMKYFFAKGVGLQEPAEALSRSELAPHLRGTAYHQVLMDYYQQLYKQGLTGQLFEAAQRAHLQTALAAHYTAQSYKQFGIYPVIWELILQQMQEKLENFVLQDAQTLQGYVPSIFETYFEKIYTPTAGLSVKLKGIIDRIDIDNKGKSFRILDYKSSRHASKNLAAVMFKQVILQPFIYLLLAQGQTATQSLAPDGAALLSIQPGYSRQELSQANFEALQQRAAEFFTFLMGLIQRGQFFINPAEHCQYCPYASICRKDAFYTLLRARRSPAARALEEAKQ